MRSWQAALLLTATFASPLAAQPAPAEASSSTAETPYHPVIVINDPQLVRDEVAVGKKFKVTGFLVRPFKAMRLKKAGSALGSLFQAINPFSREKSAPDARFEGELSTRAWSSSVSWRPGASAFANPVTHEVGLTALSVSR